MARRRRRTWLVVVGLAAVRRLRADVGVLASQPGGTAGLPSTRQGIEEHEWVLDRGDSSLIVDDDNPVTLAVHGDEVAGAAPCNAYRGSFELDDDDTVDITDIALTRRPASRPRWRPRTRWWPRWRPSTTPSRVDDDGRTTATA